MSEVVLSATGTELNPRSAEHVLVQCSDGKTVELLKAAIEKYSFLPQPDEGNIIKIEYPAVVLDNCLHWFDQYGLDGVAESDMTRPCIYRSFQFVLKGKWDNDFFTNRLTSESNIGYYLETINAAEKFNMKGLHDFLCIGLGLKFRSEDDAYLIQKVMGLSNDVAFSPEDLDASSSRYSWFNEVTAQTVKK